MAREESISSGTGQIAMIGGVKRFAIMLIALIPLSAQAELSREQFDRFQLFNNCESVGLVIGSVNKHLKEIGLTEDRLRTVAEARLRSARLYSNTDDWDAFVYVHVNGVGNALVIVVEFHVFVMRVKWVNDLRTFATTWRKSNVISHGGATSDGDYVIQVLNEMTDSFINAYLRVNAEAC